MEELKLILDTIGKLGHDAQWIFIAYLIKELSIYLLGFSCLGGGLIGAYRILRHIIPLLNFENDIKAVMDCGNWISPREKKRILDILRESKGTV